MISVSRLNIYPTPLLQSEEQTTKLQNEIQMVTHRAEQVKGKRNALHAVVRDINYRSELVNGENEYL